MIELKVDDWCQHDCLDFEPDVKKPERSVGNDLAHNQVIEFFSNTIIECKHRNRCKAIKRYLETTDK